MNNSFLYDFHIHSEFSVDAVSSTDEIAKTLKENNIKGFSITDHDSISSIPGAKKSAKRYGLNYLTGVEMNVVCDTAWAPNSYHYHLVCLGFNENDSNIKKMIQNARENEIERSKILIKHLVKNGYHFEWSEAEEFVKELNPNGNQDITLFLFYKLGIKKGYWGNAQEASLNVNKIYEELRPGFIRKERIETVIEKIHNAGGITIIAHPYVYFKNNSDIEKQIKFMVNAGAKGLEVYYKNHNKKQQEFLLSIADKYNLLISGGLDNHSIKEYQIPQDMNGPTDENYQAIISAIKNKVL